LSSFLILRNFAWGGGGRGGEGKRGRGISRAHPGHDSETLFRSRSFLEGGGRKEKEGEGGKEGPAKSYTKLRCRFLCGREGRGEKEGGGKGYSFVFLLPNPGRKGKGGEGRGGGEETGLLPPLFFSFYACCRQEKGERGKRERRRK